MGSIINRKTNTSKKYLQKVYHAPTPPKWLCHLVGLMVFTVVNYRRSC